ncbi:molybdopterin-synthase adenylyltransferase MoeB [soil metagenome]
MTNFRDLLQGVKADIEETTPEKVRERLRLREPVQILDVREQEEVDKGTVPGAAHLGRAHFESRVEDVVPDKEAPVILYCASGVRSAFAAKTLGELGYQRVESMAGGFIRWKELGYEQATVRRLEASQRDRYSRHLLLPDVGEQGQLKFLDAKVLCIGAGGLGSPALLYLAAAGVGTIGIVDADIVDASNLQRQIIHDLDHLDVPKVDSAREAIEKLNPDVRVVTHQERIDASNARELLTQYDIVVDGSDNFDTRYVLNDVAVELRKPVVHGSIFRFEGMVSTFVPFEGPCYSCLYPEAPPPELAPSCSEAGVLGVLPGIVGSLQANEALKLIGGYGQPLIGRLLTFDAQATHFGEVKVRRDPGCPVCGEDAIQELPSEEETTAA